MRFLSLQHWACLGQEGNGPPDAELTLESQSLPALNLSRVGPGFILGRFFIPPPARHLFPLFADTYRTEKPGGIAFPLWRSLLPAGKGLEMSARVSTCRPYCFFGVSVLCVCVINPCGRMGQFTTTLLCSLLTLRYLTLLRGWYLSTLQYGGGRFGFLTSKIFVPPHPYH